MSYAFDVTPTFNLLRNYNDGSRPLINFTAGIGFGYLMTYRTERFVFNNKEFDFKFLEHSAYVPIRASMILRFDEVSDFSIEGAFLNTWLDENTKSNKFKLNSNHFGQINFTYKRYIR